MKTLVKALMLLLISITAQAYTLETLNRRVQNYGDGMQVATFGVSDTGFNVAISYLKNGSGIVAATHLTGDMIIHPDDMSPGVKAITVKMSTEIKRSNTEGQPVVRIWSDTKLISQLQNPVSTTYLLSLQSNTVYHYDIAVDIPSKFGGTGSVEIQFILPIEPKPQLVSNDKRDLAPGNACTEHARNNSETDF